MENIYASFISYLETGSFLAYIVSFCAGVLVSFTPCIYPLIPINIGVITAEAPDSRLKAFYLSLSFVIGTALVYSALGIIASLMGKVFAKFQINPLGFILIGALTLFLGLSLLGLFNLPQIRLFRRHDKLGLSSQRFKVFGAFILGAAGALIIGPCTAPILGMLFLYVALKENILFGASLIFVFALGMGTLLILTGTFSQFLVNLPRSGKWNLVITKVLGWVLVIYAGFLFFKAGRLMPW